MGTWEAEKGNGFQFVKGKAYFEEKDIGRISTIILMAVWNSVFNYTWHICLLQRNLENFKSLEVRSSFRNGCCHFSLEQENVQKHRTL